MGFLDSVRSFFALDAVAPQTRAIDSFMDHPGMTEQIMAALGHRRVPYNVPGIREALGVPAILRAVSVIANVGGGLGVEAWRNGVKLSPEARPRVMVRPDPFGIARDFYRDTFYNMATRGEAWWWIAARDGDGNPLSLLNMPPHEVRVDEDPDDLRYPIIYWRDKKMRREDVRQITYLREPGELRGYGPLQMCSAAVSVAVESQEWAANFFAAGGYPNIWIKAAGDLSGGLQGDPDTDEEEDWLSEVQRLKAQWIETAPNTPKVTDEGIIDIKQFDPNPSGAQMLEARSHQVGDAARMFGMPGKILEFANPGSSLTYQNLSEVMADFLRTCLIPNYLEPVEQTMSDLVTRSTTMRFNTSEVQRPDHKTRWEVYKLATEVIGVDEAGNLARIEEGLQPGDVETAPIPFAAPQAIPTRIPVQTRSEPVEVRCDGMHTRRRSGIPYVGKCGKLLSTTGVFVGECPRCKKQYAAA